MSDTNIPAGQREVLISLRRIIRAVDLHSRSLIQRVGLTGPQLIILEELSERGECTISELSKAISLSMATVTGILSRLENRDLIHRRRDETDRRKVLVKATEASKDLLRNSPPPLQDSFVSEFEKLEDWEQTLLVSSLQRIVNMMEATQIDATPMLVTGAIDQPEDTTE